MFEKSQPLIVLFIFSQLTLIQQHLHSKYKFSYDWIFVFSQPPCQRRSNYRPEKCPS